MRRFFSFTNFVGLTLLIFGIGATIFLHEGGDSRQLNLPNQIGVAGGREFKLFFPADSGDGIKEEVRTVDISDGEDLLQRALVELVKGPQKSGLLPLVAVGSGVPSVFVRDGGALVDLPLTFKKLGLSSQQESDLFGSISSTILAFEGVDSVKYLLDGQEVESLGHISLVDPFVRGSR